MLVRSQNGRALVEMTGRSLYIREDADKKYRVRTDEGIEMGIYSTEERAMAELRRIESAIREYEAAKCTLSGFSSNPKYPSAVAQARLANKSVYRMLFDEEL